MRPAVELRGAGKRYGLRGRWILQDLTIALPPGQLVHVTGANGAGKSTLLRLIAGATRPSAGSVVRAPGGVGYAPAQLPGGLPLRVRGYLEAIAGTRGLHRSGARAEITSIAAALGLTPQLDDTARSLSTGSAHKVALVAALVGHAPLLVLDEPWAALDDEARQALGDELRARRDAGACVVVTAHGELPAGLTPERVARVERGALADCSTERAA